MHTDIRKQEISILVKNYSDLNSNIIVHLAQNLKRVNIVTTNINSFKKLENHLQDELGISTTITNNKKKSLLKSKIIINLDFDEELINSFNINRTALIINVEGKINIKSKSFTGINICDYDIIYKNYKDTCFNKNVFYESLICNLKNYNEIINEIKKDEVKIVNLIGQNGIINKKEYLRI